MSGLILYRTDDGLSEVKLRALDGTVWLSQLEIAELFATTKQNVSLHAKNILEERELDAAATVKESLTVDFFSSSPSLKILFICKLTFCLLL